MAANHLSKINYLHPFGKSVNKGYKGHPSLHCLKRCLVQRRTDFDTNGSISGPELHRFPHFPPVFWWWKSFHPPNPMDPSAFLGSAWMYLGYAFWKEVLGYPHFRQPPYVSHCFPYDRGTPFRLIEFWPCQISTCSNGAAAVTPEMSFHEIPFGY
jgi:hypothetical protein